MLFKVFLKKITAAGFVVFSFAIFGSLKHANAQTASDPTFLITWKTTGSYIPSFYQGKALPTYGSKITASLELVSAAGKVLNLSQQTIYWYVDDNLVGGGTGVQQATFSPIGDAPNTMDLRVTLPNYNGNYLVHAIEIPMVVPQAVIFAPYASGQFSQNPLAVKAIPYFFNTPDASDLSYAWSVNGQAGSNTEDPQDAQVTLPAGTQSGTSLTISVDIENHTDSTIGSASENLTYENQL